MLRVGLTGELGSGKSTVAAILAAHGAIVLSSDEMARAMMQPGEAAFSLIVERFGPSIINANGTLNRSALAKLAFNPDNPRIEELNAIIHPAVIAQQATKIAELARTQPHAVVVIESALIFTTKHTPGRWRDRFDCIVLVTAPDEMKIDRFVQRTAIVSGTDSAVREDARRRLETQRTTIPQGIPSYTIENNRSLAELKSKVDRLWAQLVTHEKRG